MNLCRLQVTFIARMKGRIEASSTKSFTPLPWVLLKWPLFSVFLGHSSARNPKQGSLFLEAVVSPVPPQLCPCVGHFLAYLKALHTPVPAEHAWEYSHGWLNIPLPEEAHQNQNKPNTPYLLSNTDLWQHIMVRWCALVPPRVSLQKLCKQCHFYSCFDERLQRPSRIRLPLELGFWVTRNARAGGQPQIREHWNLMNSGQWELLKITWIQGIFTSKHRLS